MKVKISLTGILMPVTIFVMGQTKTDALASKSKVLKDTLTNYVIRTDTTFENSLVTNRAFNLFLQKKTSYYLSGASEISLSKLYATYSSDNDKFNFGVNFRNKNDDEKLSWIASPIIETNIKKSFTTLYKKGEWQSDIRVGGKFTVFFAGSLKYYGMNFNSDQETKMIIVRNLELAKIIKKIDADDVSRADKENNSKTLLKNSINELTDNTIKIKKLTSDEGTKEKAKKTLDYLDSITNNGSEILNTLLENELEKPTSEEEYKTQIATAEVNKLYERESYTWFNNNWISFWGFIPLTERKTYIAKDNTVNFDKEKLKLWEANVQGNTIWEYNNKVSFYASVGWKVFQNNSAIADLMTSVDYYQYSQFPETTNSNLAVLDNNKAYIGDYKEFVTNNFNFQLVISLSNTNKKGKERLVTPGISAFIEKNVGDFSAMNLRFGVPLRFRGKSTPINIEPQILLKDITNYSNKAECEKPIIGINVGLPFTALFK